MNANHPKLCENCVFSQNFYARKLGEITAVFAVRYQQLFIKFWKIHMKASMNRLVFNKTACLQLVPTAGSNISENRD